MLMGCEGPQCPSTLGLIKRPRKQPPSPSASSAVHTEIKTMSSVSANMVLISPVCPRAPTLRGGKALQSQRDREETWRDRPSRSATTLTAPSLHFRFRGADPELQASLPPSGRHSRERAATRKSRGRRRAPGPVSRELESQVGRRMAVWWRRRCDLGSALPALRARSPTSH